MSRELENKRATMELIESLKSFDDSEIRVYTRFAAEWRDQRIAEGSPAEVAFWNSVVSLCVDERQRRKTEPGKIPKNLHTIPKNPFREKFTPPSIVSIAIVPKRTLPEYPFRNE